jgi:CRP/FNR family cyclic AMP-dependent transcriptional regulator
VAVPVELLRKVDLFEEMSDRELGRLAKSFRESRFTAGDTIAAEGTRGVGFFVIGEGIVRYIVHGEDKGFGGPGDYFGEIALIDDGPRTASVVADTDVVAYGLVSWEFQPLVEENAAMAWELLQGMAKRLRAANQNP